MVFTDQDDLAVCEHKMVGVCCFSTTLQYATIDRILDSMRASGYDEIGYSSESF
jgi:hypothetical protein